MKPMTKAERKRAKKLKHMIFSRSARCQCGAGLAYDATCVEEPFKGPSYWDCSAILLGDAVPSGEPGAVRHDDRYPFSFWDIKAEQNGVSTRPVSHLPTS